MRADEGDRLEVTPRSVEAGSWRVENSLVQSLDVKREAGRCGQLQVCGLFQSHFGYLALLFASVSSTPKNPLAHPTEDPFPNLAHISRALYSHMQ